jgi:hypothetical protein
MSRSPLPLGLALAGLLAFALAAPASPPKEKQIEALLHRPINASFHDTSWKKVVQDLAAFHGLPLVIDKQALAEEGINLNEPVSLKLHQVSLRSALNLVLQPFHLTYVVKEEVVIVTTRKRARGALVTQTYAVADLVIPVDRAPVVVAVESQQAEIKRVDPKKIRTVENDLIALITSTVSPRDWSNTGGPGTIEYFPLSMSLVVNQTADVQEQVAELLAALRRLMDLEVSLEVRLLHVPARFCEQVELGHEPKFLDERHFEELLSAAQKYPATHVFQAPKLTAFDGQEALYHIGEKENASIYLLPRASADRRSVRLKMELSKHDPQDESRASTVVIPDGNTVVLVGWTEAGVAQEVPASPVLTKIPYISRLFRNVGYGEEECVVLCVTPRIIVAAEEEEARPTESRVEKLVKHYHWACAGGDLARAKKLARKALELDPTCFDR